MSATYTPQQWADNDPTKPVSAARMAYIEAGIAALVTAINALPDPTAAAQTLITALNLGSAATHPASDFDTPAARSSAITAAITALGLGTASTHPASDFATPANITAAINNLVGAAPGALDTIYELAAQLQSDETAAAALTTAVGTNTAAVAGGVVPTKVASLTPATASAAPTVQRLNLYDATSGALTPALPAASSVAAGVVVGFKKTDATANTVTPTCAGSDHIGSTTGSTSIPIRTQDQITWLASDGTSVWTKVDGELSLPSLDGRFAGAAGTQAQIAVRPGQGMPVADGGYVGFISATAVQTSFLTSRTPYAITVASTDLRPVFVNFRGGTNWNDTDNAVVVQFTASFEYAGVIYPYTFGGRRVATLEAGGVIQPDPLSVDTTPGTFAFVRACPQPIIRGITTTSASSTVLDPQIQAGDTGRAITAAGNIPAGLFVGTVVPGVSFTLSTSQTAQAGSGATIQATASGSVAGTYSPKWFGTRTASNSTAQGGQGGTAAGDLTGVTTAIPDVAGAVLFAPSAMLGTPLATSQPPTLFRYGDSINGGLRDGVDLNPTYPRLGGGGWIGRAARAGGFGDINSASSGNTASAYVTQANRTRRGQFAAYAATALGNFGSNDIVTNLISAAALQTLVVQIWSMYGLRGRRQLWSTLLPRPASSSDFWTTLGGQTLGSYSGVIVTMNQWYRDGAPMIAGSPVTPGATGSNVQRAMVKRFVAGVATVTPASGPAHPVYCILDVASAVESATDSGLWLPAVSTVLASDGAATAASPTITSASSAFTLAGNVGYQLRVPGAGASGADVVTQIYDVPSPTSLTIAANATTTVSGVTLTQVDAYTNDGIHPQPRGAAAISALLTPDLVA